MLFFDFTLLQFLQRDFENGGPSRESVERIIAQEQASNHENEEESTRNIEVTQEPRRQELSREDNDELFGVLPVADDEND